MTQPDDRLWNRAQRYLAQGQLVHARATLDSMLARGSATTRTHLLCAQIAREEDRIRDAARHALDAARMPCDDPDQSCEVIEALWKTGEIAAMRECMTRPALRNPATAVLALELSGFRQWLGENVDALALLERARALGADDARTRFHHGALLAFNGRLQEAETELETSLRMAPTLGRTAVALARMRRQTPECNHLALIDEGLHAVAPGTRDHAALEFACYKELEDLARFDDAWQALIRGNEIMHAREPYDAAEQRRHMDAMIARCTAHALRPAEVTHTGPQPIFILGLTRSGTTLLERILGNHSRVETGGELGDFGRQLQWAVDHASTLDDAFLERLPELDFAEVGRRYLERTQWRARDKAFFTDKQPPNWMLAGLIHAALPRARIVHLVRDPMDVCFSNWRAFFGEVCAFSYDLSALAAYYHDYRRLMAHWHAIMPDAIMDVPYAELVRDPETTARKVFAFCGIDWEPGCLDITRNAAPVSTLSVAQVRSDIHARAFEEWRRYAENLRSLQTALADASLPAAS